MTKKDALPVRAMNMLVAAALVISLTIVAVSSQTVTAASPIISRWDRVSTPSQEGWVLAPSSAIIDYAVADEGKAAYAIVERWDWDDYGLADESWGVHLLKSTDHAATWRDITSRLKKEIDRKALGGLCGIDKVATAPDDPDFVAVALRACLPGQPAHIRVFISSDGGTTFRDTGAVADAWDELLWVNDFAISPVDKDDWRDIAIGGAGTEGGHIYRAQAVGSLATSWVDATTYAGWDDRCPDTMVTGFDSAAVVAIKFAPSWDADKTILIATVTGWGPNNSVHLQSGTWGTDMAEAWNEGAGFERAVPIVEDVVIQQLSGLEAGITLPTDYAGGYATRRFAWVWVNYWDATGVPLGEIYVVDDASVQAVCEQIRNRPWLTNVSYWGTIAFGKAIAGLLGTGDPRMPDWLYTEPCQGVQVYRYDDVGPNMDICCPAWKPSCKPPTGSLAMEAFYVTEDRVYSVALWDDSPFGEGAWSFSFDDGYNWNQLSLIDTWITYLSDVAVSPNCSKTMAVSINYGPGFATDADNLCDSVWYRAENQTHAPEYGGKWLRTWSGQFSGSHPLYDLKWGLLRLAPEQIGGETVYLVDLGSNRIYYNGMQTLACWEPGRSTIDSIIDLAVKDERTIYALGLEGYIAMSDDYAVAPSWTKPVDTEMEGGWSIAVRGEDVLAGGQDGDVSYSDDGGLTFTELQDVAASGLVTVVFDSYFDANDTIYAALHGAGTYNGIYRWVIGESMRWTDLRAEPYDYTGLVLANTDGNPLTTADKGGVLYASYVSQTGGDIHTGVARCLTPAEELCCDMADWDYLVDGLTSSEAFVSMPRALKICGGLTVGTSSKLSAIDGSQYDMDRGRDGTVWQFITHDWCQIVTTKLPGGPVEVAYEATLKAMGGFPPYTWGMIAGGLPGGLVLDSKTGVIWGTPTKDGTFNFTIQVTDTRARTATADLSIIVVKPVEIVTAALPAGQVQVAYEATLKAMGGFPPYTWGMIAGGLPGGLVLDTEAGVVSGTPTQAGTFNFTVQVTDAGDSTATRELALTIHDPIEDWLVDLSLLTDPHIGTIPGPGSTFAFGAREGATEGYDAAEGDQIAPPDPITGVTAHFYYPDNPAFERNLVTSVVGPKPAITWPLLVKSVGDPGATEATLTWDQDDVDNAPDEYAVLELRDTAGNTLADMRTEASYTFSLLSGETKTFHIVAAEHVEFVYELKAGWNMISVPLHTEETSPAVLFPGHVIMYAWHPPTLSYSVPTELVPGQGYWVLYFDDTTVTISGTPVKQYELVDAVAGWHMIGSLSVDAQLTVTEGAIYPLFYWWNPLALSYEATDTLEPGKGYWLLGFTPFGIVVGSFSEAENDKPYIRLLPGSGVPGTEVTVRGYNFAPDQSVDIYYAGAWRTDALATTGAISFSASFIVPESHKGSHQVLAEGSEDNAWALFLVTPGVTVSPSQGSVGIEVTVTGRGFGMNEGSIEIRFDDQVVADGIRAHVSGSWEESIVIPLTTGGRYTIRADGEAGSVATGSFDVKPGIVIDEPSGSPGQSITITGNAFAANERHIKILFDGDELVTDIRADDRGYWQETFEVPDLPAGDYTVTADGDRTKSTDLDAISFQIRPGLVLTPDKGHVGMELTVNGGGFGVEQDVAIMHEDTVVATATTNDKGIFEVGFIVPESRHGMCEVTAEDAEGNESTAIFIMESDPPPTPELVSPADGERVDFVGPVRPIFEWSEVFDVSGVYYSLQISTSASVTADGDFVDLIVSREGLVEPSYTLTDAEALPYGTYYWIVQAVDGAENRSGWTDVYSFWV